MYGTTIEQMDPKNTRDVREGSIVKYGTAPKPARNFKLQFATQPVVART